MQPAVFLDRDNTLIVSHGDLGDPEQVRLTDGAAAGIRSLRRAGYAIVVVTNQAGVARGKFAEEDVDAVNQRIAMLIDEQAGESHLIDRFYYCPYDPEAAIEEYRRDHPWRKPHPGMLLQAARDLDLDLAQSWMIGDQPDDVEAGRAAGCRTVMMTRGESGGMGTAGAGATASAQSFSEAVELVLRAPQPAGSGAARRYARQRDGASAGHESTEQFPDRAAPTTGPSDVAGGSAGEMRRMRRSLQELTEELRADRLHRTEFSALRLLAGVVQLFVLLCVLQGLLEVRDTEIFLKWMSGAILIQLAVMTLLIVDMRR